MRTRFRRRSLRGSWISLAVKRKNRWRTIVSDQERGRSSPVVPPINVQLIHSRHCGDARLLHAVELGATAMQMGTVGRTQAPANLASLINHASDAGVHALSNVCHVDVERTSKRKPGEAFKL
ncbi:hypothetical protein Drorol1_Dr00018265 [Drosera rotundifolia]